MLTLGILASGNLGFKTLIQLVEKYQISFVLTDFGSKNIIEYCLEQDIPCFKGNPRNGKVYEFLKKKPVEIIISINYLFLVEEDIITHPSGLIFNIHGSLLPKYRGRTPHVWAIINGETEVGITAHKMDKGCDTGDILEQISIPVSLSNTGAEILSEYEKMYYPLIETILVKYNNNTLECSKQNESESTYFGKREPEDGEINWFWNHDTIRNWVRAQAYPYPGAFTFIKGEKIIVDEVILVQFKDHYKDYEIGEVVNVKPNIIRCNNGYLKLILRQKIELPLGSLCQSINYE